MLWPAYIDTFMEKQEDLADQNIQIYVYPPSDGEKPVYFINDAPLYVFSVWVNPKMNIFVSSESVIEAFDKIIYIQY